MVLTALYLTDPAFDDVMWRRHFELMAELHRRHGASFTRTSWQDHKTRVLSLAEKEKTWRRFVVIDNDRMVGWGDNLIRHDGSPNRVGRLGVDAVYDAIPDEFARVVAREVKCSLLEFDCPRTYILTESQRISNVFRRYSARELNRIDLWVLKREKANVALMKQWSEEAPRANPALRLQFWDGLPEERLQRYVDLFKQFVDDMPKDGESGIPFGMTSEELGRNLEWRRRHNHHTYTVAALDESDEMVGFSTGFFAADDPTDAHQGMTGVDRAYRGRGLSKWLKAELFFMIGNDFPGNKTMSTEMRAANEAILAINARMGYELRSKGNEFEVSVECLTRYLDNSE